MKNKANLFFVYCIAMSAILVTITIIRAATTGITEDEAWTYLHWVHHNPLDVLKYLNIKETFFTTGNNHILNSFLISFLELFFHHNYNEFVIRLPNVISYIWYLLFAYLITKDTKYKYLNFSLLVLNYGVNEFFGLARGYGMACAFVLGGIYFFKKYLLQKKNYLLTLSYLSLLTACYASTASLIVFASIICVSFLSLFRDNQFFKYALNQIFFLLPIVIATLIIIRYHFLMTKDDPTIYCGPTGSFYSDVLESLLNVYGFNKRLISHAINLSILFSIVIIAREFDKLKNSYIILTGGVFFLFFIGLTKVTNQPWMTGRCLIPSMPLLIMMIVEIINVLKIKKNMLFQTVLIIPLLIMFGLNLNVKATREWKNHYPLRESCYAVFKNNKDNADILHLRGCGLGQFYREKILKENNYDIFY
ncbi:MAG: hypothetical protein IKZ86_15265 [Spirochaetaceae bacterium]|nr:hypothetical protein [Spirochaetaceae bacterium]